MPKDSHPALALVLLLAVAPVLRSADPVVSKVTSSQRAETKLVDLTFGVSDADSDQLLIAAKISHDTGANFLVSATAPSGDTSTNAATTPTTHALV